MDHSFGILIEMSNYHLEIILFFLCLEVTIPITRGESNLESKWKEDQQQQQQCGNYQEARRYPGRYLTKFSSFYLEDPDLSGWIQEVNFSSINPPISALPIAGDWTSSGFASVGLFDPTQMTFHLKYNTSSGNGPDFSFQYNPLSSGNPVWSPIAGDWTGKGFASVGLFDHSTNTFYLKNSNTAGNTADITIVFSPSGVSMNLMPLYGMIMPIISN